MTGPKLDKPNHFIFLDNASSTKCCNAALGRLHHYNALEFANPSSHHAMGLQAARAIKDARRYFSEVFEVEPGQVVFTSGGSEANNFAIKGLSLNRLGRSKPLRGNIIISAVEHPSVIETAKYLEKFGFEIRKIPVEKSGAIDQEKLLNAIDADTFLVSIMQVNNITGAIFPIEDLAKQVKESANKFSGTMFHTDAIQGFGKLKNPTSTSMVDMISLSGHKIKGPKGVGALIVLNKEILKKKQIDPLISGGGQEMGLRSGTPSAGLISAFHLAAKKAIDNQPANLSKVHSLCAKLKNGIKDSGFLSERIVWLSPENSVATIISLSVPKIATGALSKLIEERGFIVSTGSACHSGQSEPDKILSAFGHDEVLSRSGLRVSFSDENSEVEIDNFLAALEDSIRRASTLTGLKI